jgi:hypothetical protein
LNLNDLSVWAMGGETNFGIPPIRRTVSSSMLRDGDHVAASSYGNRELNLTLELFSSTADTAAAQLQLLQRELDREKNILQYTPGGATNTVFFRTFRTSPDAVRWDPNRRQVKVTILAEPFALGLREDIAAITVRNNPTLTNGLFANLTSIKGDVETPLFIEYADGAGGLARSGFAVGVRWGSSPYPNHFHQAESMNLAADTTVVADAAMSGGSKTRTTFAGFPALTLRLSMNFPNATDPAGAENWGVYRIFARVAQTVAGDVITMAAAGGGAYNRAVQIKSQTQPQLVDLGTVDTTSGLPTFGGYAATEYRVSDQMGINIKAGRTSGSGNLDIDYVAFVPADECFGAWTAFADPLVTTDLGVIDGPNAAVYIAEALNGATPGRHGIRTTSIFGRLPIVRPGDNRLVIVESSQGQTPPTSNLLTTTISMTCRYWPRYVSIARPATT